jgi:Icc-related predicted phosphoesterase
MKLVVTSDIHNDLALSNKLIETVKKESPDLVVLLGDIGEFGEIPRGLIGNLIKYIDSYKILLILGNHETPEVAEFLSRIYKIRSIYKGFFELNGISFVCIGGGDVPLFMISDSEIQKFVEEIKENVKNKKFILLSHIHPRYTRSSMIGGGSKVLYSFIKEMQPLIAIHGHIHETGGLEEIIIKTRVINAARSIFVIELSESEIKVKKIL